MIQIGTRIAGRLTGRRVAPLAPAAMPAAAPGKVASASSLTGLVEQKLAAKLGADPGIRFGDGSFYLPTLAQVRGILEASQADRRTWLAERFDCDDFAYVLKGEMSVHAYEANDLSFGLCVGIVWGDFDWVQGYHAVNWFIDADGALRFIEPQTDEIFEMDRCQGNISLLLV